MSTNATRVVLADDEVLIARVSPAY